MTSQDQSQAFDIPPAGCRKIVIATNIAETGITIPDVVFVVDTGKVKENRLEIEGVKISKDMQVVSGTSYSRYVLFTVNRKQFKELCICILFDEEFKLHAVNLKYLLKS